MILFGATGMIGQGVLRECLLDARVESVLSIGRKKTGTVHAKLTEIVLPDLFDYSSVEKQLAGFDACFFCLGVSSAGMQEKEYERVTYGIAIAAAEGLARKNPQMTFVFVSGAGTDSSERGRSMWARVKGRTENALLRLPFKAAYMFRPGFIQPLHGIRSRTRIYRVTYAIAAPLMPVLRFLFPSSILTTEEIARAMIAVAQDGAPKSVLEVRDIVALSRMSG
ncbi:MAG TPA: NAD(P)H-binding protein [Candidatus Acidoferrales bacterium]